MIMSSLWLNLGYIIFMLFSSTPGLAVSFGSNFLLRYGLFVKIRTVNIQPRLVQYDLNTTQQILDLLFWCRGSEASIFFNQGFLSTKVDTKISLPRKGTKLFVCIKSTYHDRTNANVGESKTICQINFNSFKKAITISVIKIIMICTFSGFNVDCHYDCLFK